MNISLTFTELSGYVKSRYGKELTFSKASEKTLRISYVQKILFKDIRIPVDLAIEDVRPDTIAIRYDGGFGIDMIITGAIAFLKAKLPEFEAALQTSEGHRLNIQLSKIEQTKKAMEILCLKDILIHPDKLEIILNLK